MREIQPEDNTGSTESFQSQWKIAPAFDLTSLRSKQS